MHQLALDDGKERSLTEAVTDANVRKQKLTKWCYEFSILV
jgi:hypothetical protein